MRAIFKKSLQRAWTMIILLWFQLTGRKSCIELGRSARFSLSSRIRLQRGTKLILGNHSSLDGTVTLANGSRLTIGTRSVINRVDISGDGGCIDIGEANWWNAYSEKCRMRVQVRAGELRTENNVILDVGSLMVKPGAKMSFGEYASVGERTEIRAEAGVRVGAYTMISYDVSIFDSNTHSLRPEDRRREVHTYFSGPVELGKVRREPVAIGSDCWIGHSASILKGASLGDRCIVGTHAVVPAGNYPADSTLVAAKLRILNSTSTQTKSEQDCHR